MARILTTALIALALLAACGDDDDTASDGSGLVDAIANSPQCPEVGETIAEDFDGCKQGDTLLIYQSHDCTDGRTLIYMEDVGHGFVGEEMRSGEWSSETVSDCTG